MASTNRSRPVRIQLDTNRREAAARGVTQIRRPASARRASTSDREQTPRAQSVRRSRARGAARRRHTVGSAESATAGSQSRTPFGSGAASPSAMYGGLDTTTRARDVQQRPEQRASARISTGASQRADRQRRVVPRDVERVERDVGPVHAREMPFGGQRDRDGARPGADVDRDAAAVVRRGSSSTSSTSCSVSGRGMSTRSSTSSVRWRNDRADPTAYASGAPRRAGSRRRCARVRGSVARRRRDAAVQRSARSAERRRARRRSRAPRRSAPRDAVSGQRSARSVRATRLTVIASARRSVGHDVRSQSCSSTSASLSASIERS